MPAPAPESLPAIVNAVFIRYNRPMFAHLQNAPSLALHRPGTLVSTLAARSESPALATGIRAGAVLFVAALTAAAAQVSLPLPFTPVPLTLQPMIVLLGAAALGARLGTLSQVMYLAAGLAGMPVFAASPLLPQGALRLFGPTFPGWRAG